MSRQQVLAFKFWLVAAYGWALVCGVVAFTIPVARTSTVPQVHQTLFEHSHSVIALGGSLMGTVLRNIVWLLKPLRFNLPIYECG
jgi:hypothetical protein